MSENKYGQLNYDTPAAPTCELDNEGRCRTHTREHELSNPKCWCNPIHFELCSECEPFPARDDDAFTAMLAVQCSFIEYDGTARRPERSKGCWKCGGDGCLKVDLAEYAARGEYSGPPLVRLHQPECPQ